MPRSSTDISTKLADSQSLDGHLYNFDMLNFLDLPAEIRLRIYEHLYASQSSYLMMHLEHSKRRIYEGSSHRSILLTSRQCYEEAIILHQESLTHLYVQCGRFDAFRPTLLYPDVGAPYDRLFQSMFWNMPLDGHTRQLLADVRQLTLPSFISADVILNTFERSGLVSLDTIEFVSHGGPLFDRKPVPLWTPLYWDYPHQNRGMYPGVLQPIWHLNRANFDWNDINTLRCDARQRLPGGQFRVLWTTQARWTRPRANTEETGSEVVYQNPSVDPFCYFVDYVSRRSAGEDIACRCIDYD